MSRQLPINQTETLFLQRNEMIRLIFTIFCLVVNLRLGAIQVPMPEESPLFVPYVDPWSRVTSYVLKPGLAGECHQSLYFTQKSLTDDGRFLVFKSSDNEFRNRDGSPRGNDGPRPGISRSNKMWILDLATGILHPLERTNSLRVFLDVEKDVLYYLKYRDAAPEKGFLMKRNLLEDPESEIKVCPLPDMSDYGKLKTYCSHLTLTRDRKYAFLDIAVGDHFIQGLLNLEAGSFDKWGETDFLLNHGQIHPTRNDMALAAFECEGWRDSKGVVHDLQTMDFENGFYPRLQLLGPGWRRMVPSRLTNFAMHECWDDKGDGFYWCGPGVYYQDLKTGQQRRLAPKGSHATVSRGLDYVAVDRNVDHNYRGNPWQVYFHNVRTGQGVNIVTYRPALCPNLGSRKVSTQHPDPHPCFVARDRYIVYTLTGEGGYMDIALTPVTQLVSRTTRDLNGWSRTLPASAVPREVLKRLPADTLGDSRTNGCVAFAAYERNRSDWDSFDVGVHAVKLPFLETNAVSETVARQVLLEVAASHCIGDDVYLKTAVARIKKCVTDWSAADGWMAVALSSVLYEMKTFHPDYHDLLSGYLTWANQCRMRQAMKNELNLQELEALLVGLREDWLTDSDFGELTRAAYLSALSRCDKGDDSAKEGVKRCVTALMRPPKDDSQDLIWPYPKPMVSTFDEDHWMKDSSGLRYECSFKLRMRQFFHVRTGGRAFVEVSGMTNSHSSVSVNGSAFSFGSLGNGVRKFDVSRWVRFGQNSLAVTFAVTNDEGEARKQAFLNNRIRFVSYPACHYDPESLDITTTPLDRDSQTVSVSYKTFEGVRTNFTFNIRHPIVSTPGLPYEYYLRVGDSSELVSFPIERK